MAQKNIADLTSEANVIRDETTAGANTKLRVRNMLINIIDSYINNDRIDTANGLDTVGKDIPGKDAVKNYITNAIASIGGGPAIADTYADIAALIAAQGDQEENALYYVADASDDPTVDSGWAVYRYLGTTDGDLDDYQKLSEEESLDVIFNVLGTALTGYSVGSNTAIADTDTILQAFGKAQGQINARALNAVQFDTQSGTTYTIQASDYGKRIHFTSDSNVTVTLPDGLPQGFWCEIEKKGDGNVSCAPDTGNGASLESYGTTITEQYGIALLVNEGSDVWALHGRII